MLSLDAPIAGGTEPLGCLLAEADGLAAWHGQDLSATEDADLRHDLARALGDLPEDARRKFWQSFTVAGGKLDEKGQSIGWKISKSTFRAIVDSALGLDPKDESPGAKAKRVLPGLRHLEGIIFAARIMVEPASNPQYRDQNRIANVILPDELQHAAIMRGETIAPEPVNAPPRKAASVTAPGWQAPTPAWGAAQPSPAAQNWGAAPQPAAAPAPAWGTQTAPAAPPAPQAPSPAAPGAPAMPAWLNG